MFEVEVIFLLTCWKYKVIEAVDMKLTLCSDLFTVSICFFVCKLAFIYLQCLRNVQVGYGLVVRIGFPIQGFGLDKD